MLFYILLGFISIFCTLTIVCIFIEGEAAALCFMAVMLLCAPLSISWVSYAKSVSNINNQYMIVEQYQEHVDSLNNRLQNFDYPKGALMSADTPVAAIVNSLSVAEEKLLEAKASRINSIKEIEATRLGPMSGVINFVGDYKQQEEK